MKKSKVLYFFTTCIALLSCLDNKTEKKDNKLNYKGKTYVIGQKKDTLDITDVRKVFGDSAESFIHEIKSIDSGAYLKRTIKLVVDKKNNEKRGK